MYQQYSEAIFRGLIHQEFYPECWRSTNVTTIPKGAPSPDMENYRPISITPILSKVCEKLVSHKFSNFCKKYVFYLLLNLLILKVCTDALLTISHQFQKSLDTGMESYIVELDFIATFNRVSHSGLLFKLKSIGVGGTEI